MKNLYKFNKKMSVFIKFHFNTDGNFIFNEKTKLIEGSINVNLEPDIIEMYEYYPKLKTYVPIKIDSSEVKDTLDFLKEKGIIKPIMNFNDIELSTNIESHRYITTEQVIRNPELYYYKSERFFSWNYFGITINFAVKDRLFKLINMSN